MMQTGHQLNALQPTAMGSFPFTTSEVLQPALLPNPAQAAGNSTHTQMHRVHVWLLLIRVGGLAFSSCAVHALNNKNTNPTCHEVKALAITQRTCSKTAPAALRQCDLLCLQVLRNVHHHWAVHTLNCQPAR
jgi:hypothetical protein